MDLRAIQKIVGDDDHTFIYIASVNALIVPMKAYPDEDFDEFIAELRQAWEERIAAPPEDDAWRPAVDERIVRRS
jgi:hypothetical protein